MKASLKMFLLYCCTVPLFAESGAAVPFVDHPPVDAAALHLHEQEMAFMDERFTENTDSRIIWQADHKIALAWHTPRGANFNLYIFKAFQREKDGSFKEIGVYEVFSRYGYWDEKNIRFSPQGFEITLMADKDKTRVSHQFLYERPNCIYYYRLDKEEEDSRNGEKPFTH